MTAQASRTAPTQGNLEARFDHDIRILPEPEVYDGKRASVLLAFDAQAQQPLTEIGFAASLENTFGIRAENRVQVPLTWVAGEELIAPSDEDFFERIRGLRGPKPKELGGYFGIRLSKEGGMGQATNEVAAGIAAIISDIYHGDERLRILYNHTLDEPTEPIEITGPDYNLSEEATDEHPLADLKEIVGHPISLRRLEVAPDLARVSFA